MVMGFIEAHHKDLGIEPICRELAVAPSFWLFPVSTYGT